MNINAQEYKLVHPAELQEHPKNPRRGNLEAISESIEQNGFYGAVIAQRSTGYVLVGNHRLKSARAKEAQSIPVIYVDVDDEQAVKILLADNRTGDLGGYDDTALAAILSECSDIAGTGYDQAAFDEILAGVTEPEKAKEDEGPQIDRAEELREKWKTERGQLWVIGRHRLLCGDSTSAEDVTRLTDGKKADMVFTDPPYNVDYNPDSAPTNADKRRKKNPLGTIKSDAMSDSDFIGFLRAIVGSMIYASRPGACAYVCHADLEGLNFRTAFQEAYKLSSVLVWSKNNFSIGRKDYHWMHEPILYGWPLGTTHEYYGDRSQTSIWGLPKDSVNDYVHPTQKPVALSQRAVENSSKRGDGVLDLFGGSGSTMVACEKTARAAYLMELDPRYIAVILERMSAMGLEPRLEAE
jgi:DNA modification methylase